MTTTYNSLSATNKAKTSMVAVSMFGGGTAGFCKGAFPAVSVSQDGWPAKWGVAQRDVVVMFKDPCSGWKVHCKFSLNSHMGDFAGVINDLLAKAAKTCKATSGNDTSSVVNFAVVLNGLTSAQFDVTARESYKSVIAAQAGSACSEAGKTGQTCTSKHVTIGTVTDVRRAGIRVSTGLQTDSTTAATKAAGTLKTALEAASFVTTLKAQGGNLNSVTSTALASAPTSGGDNTPTPAPTPAKDRVTSAASTVGSGPARFSICLALAFAMVFMHYRAPL